MPSPARLAAAAGAAFGATGVAIAALADHLAPHHLAPARIAILKTGVQMQLWHAPALLAAAALLRRGTTLGAIAVAGLALGLAAFLAGVYALAVLGRSLGPLAPIGGTTLICAWALLGIAAWRELASPGERDRREKQPARPGP